MDAVADVDHDGEMSESVRRLGPEEWRLLREVRLRALADAPYAFGSTWEEDSAREDEWWIASVTALGWFVAVNGAEATGLIAAIEREESGDHHVISTWVAPERRGSGIAQQLIAAVVAWALDHGASGLALDVAENNPRARRFYERTGFVATGVAKPLRSHPGVTTHEMRLEAIETSWGTHGLPLPTTTGNTDRYLVHQPARDACCARPGPPTVMSRSAASFMSGR